MKRKLLRQGLMNDLRYVHGHQGDQQLADLAFKCAFQQEVLQEQVRQLEEVLVYEVEQEVQQLEKKMSVHWVCLEL